MKTNTGVFAKTESKTAKEMMNQPFPFQNNDRYVVVSVVEDKKNRVCFLKIHGQYPTQGQAESIATSAVKQGYSLRCLVADSAAWLPLPPDRIAKEVHVGDQLEKIVGKQIEEENASFDRMMKRRKRATKATTAYERYMNLVNDSAEDMILKLRAGKEREDLEKKFEEFRKREEEIAMKEAQSGQLNPSVQKFLNKKRELGQFTPSNERKQAEGKIGMGLPKF